MASWIKDPFEHFRKVNHTFWNVLVLGVKYALLSFLLAAVYYGIFAAFVSTDTEKRLQKENALYEKLYPGMLEREKRVSDVIDYLQIRDGRIYQDVFYAHAPSLDPVASTDFFSGSDTIPDTFDWNLWLGVAPKRPFKKGVYHTFKWRGWFDFGTGAMGDIACHAMSFFWRGLDLERVLSVETIKTTPRFAETYPAATTVKLVVTSRRQKKPVEIYWYDGKTGPDEATARRLTGGVMSSLGGTTIVGENGVFRGGTLMMKGERKFMRWQDHPATRALPVTLPRVKNHHWEFAEAVRGGAKPFSHIDHSVPLTEAVLLGCISQRIPGRLVWDAAKCRFENSDEANALLVPYIRSGWQLG